jgi:hypothetical protein
MDNGVSAFLIACWTFTTITMTYNVFAFWRPLPRGFNEKAKLREQALRIITDSNKDEFTKELDRAGIQHSKSVESLRLCVRFVEHYRVVDLNLLASSIHLARTRLQTTLTPLGLSPEQVACYIKFDSFMAGFFIDGDFESAKKRKKELSRTAVYAMGHMSEADAIYDIVERRGVYQLKQVKALLKDIDDSPAGALSDGTL